MRVFEAIAKNKAISVDGSIEHSEDETTIGDKHRRRKLKEIDVREKRGRKATLSAHAPNPECCR